MKPTTTPEHLLEVLRWRYATKHFDAHRPIADDVWQALEEALVLAPSSFGLQPWKFVVVDDPALRRELRLASWRQAQITDAARLVVFLGRRSLAAPDVDRYLRRVHDVTGKSVEALGGYRKVIVHFLDHGWAAGDLAGWNARQVYLALGQFMTAAAMLGVDTCPMEGIDMPAYDRLLGLDGSDFTTLVACTAGYRLATDKYATTPKVRYDRHEIVERR
ncbi:MAG TPA: NAD(P)H-dependent oxidoreductase [Planctomycetota bacterium]|nr:NAD(P)H-dependent oxidoreductase [Planctomycetota bacterium]